MKQHTFIHKGLSRLWYALIILMLLIPCFHIALADTGYSGGETAIVSNPDPADRLNLRKSPSESAESLGKYYNGVAVQLDEPIQNGWVRVTIGADGGSAQGYMLAQYLAFDQAAQNVAPATPLYQTVSNKWSLRATPSDSGKKLSIRYASGMQVELLGFTSSWWHVRVNNQTGYIMHNPSAFKQISGNYYDGYRIGIVNNPNAADRLNLRNQAKDNATSLGKYYNGCPVALLSGEKNGWVNVRIGNLEGYMQSRYLTLDATLGSIPSAMPNVTIRNASGTGLNLRESPMQNSSSLALYANGTSVQVLGLSKNWSMSK